MVFLFGKRSKREGRRGKVRERESEIEKETAFYFSLFFLL
jgi:hypothetical protein